MTNDDAIHSQVNKELVSKNEECVRLTAQLKAMQAQVRVTNRASYLINTCFTARARVRCLQFPIPPAAARDFDAAQMIHVYHRRSPVSYFLAVCVLQIVKQMPTRVQVKTLTHMKETLGHNVSSLYKTAVSEIQRKDTQIKDLNARQVSLPARAEQKAEPLPDRS